MMALALEDASAWEVSPGKENSIPCAVHAQPVEVNRKPFPGVGMSDSITVDGLCKRSARLAGRFLCQISG